MAPTSTIITIVVCFSVSFANAFIITKPPRCLPNDNRLFAFRAEGESLSSTTTKKMLWQMTTFFSSMVDNDRFHALCLPQSDERIRVHCPLRDSGAAWDATTALLFWRDQQEWLAEHTDQLHEYEELLVNAVCGTIKAYNASYVSLPSNAGLSLDATILLEPPNIAHSAFLLLATTGAVRLSLFQNSSDNIPPMNDLVRGILTQQRNDGAFAIEFGNANVYSGIEFYPGEAMVALMEVYEQSESMPGILESSTQQAILPVMERAFQFYSNHYHQGHVDTNYNIWQVQAFARLFYVLYEKEEARKEAKVVADYVMELCQDIVKSRSWKELARGKSFYPNLQTVEIACGLDALAEGIHVASIVSQADQEALFRRNAENAVDFLQWIQDLVPLGVTGSGGLGYGGVQVFEQRLDVTGHALSALVKLSRLDDTT